MKSYLFVMVCAALGGAIVKAQSLSTDKGMRRNQANVPPSISLSDEDTIIATPVSAIRVRKVDFYSGRYLLPDRLSVVEDTVMVTPFSAIRVRKADFYSGEYLFPDRRGKPQPGEGGGLQTPEMKGGSIRRPYHENTFSSP